MVWLMIRLAHLPPQWAASLAYLFAYRSRPTVFIAKQSCMKGDVSHRESRSRSRRNLQTNQDSQKSQVQYKIQHTSSHAPLQLQTCPVPSDPYAICSQVGYFTAKAPDSPYANTRGGRNCPRVPINRSCARATITLHLDNSLDGTETYAA